MSTPPGIAFVTRASRDLGRNTALDLADPPHERGDAARNRALLLDAARRLIAARGPDAVTMDEIAAAAGVGKGTLFRRFGSRAGLMIVLLDEDEQAEQQAFLFGPAPLGPSAPPVERLLAYGRARLKFVHTHHTLLSDIDRDPQSRYTRRSRCTATTYTCCWMPQAPPATSTRRRKRCWLCRKQTSSNIRSTSAA
jgi:AcrR family transcriptional regulator